MTEADAGAGQNVPSDAVTENPPDDLAMVQPPLALLGGSTLTGAPGTTVTIDHLVENLTAATETVAVQARTTTDGLVVETTPSSLQLDSGDVAAITTTVRIDAGIGDDASFELLAVFADDTTQRTGLTITVTGEEVDGARPELGDDRATTSTNERVISYVVGNDVDPDGDLDLTTLRIVAGAGRAAQAQASPDGTITYEPFANRTGSDVVLYELCDRAGHCDTAALTVTVQG